MDDIRNLNLEYEAREAAYEDQRLKISRQSEEADTDVKRAKEEYDIAKAARGEHQKRTSVIRTR
jgi:hypothetical protein